MTGGPSSGRELVDFYRRLPPEGYAQHLMEFGLRAEQFALDSTRRQLDRYVNWRTNANGFFPGLRDRSEDARALVKLVS